MVGVENSKKQLTEAFLSSSVAKPCIGFQCDFNALLLRAVLLKRREEYEADALRRTVGAFISFNEITSLE